MMTPSRLTTTAWQTTRWLDGLAVVSALAALAVVLAPPPRPSAQPPARAASAPASAPVVPPASVDDASAIAAWRLTVVGGNLFSVTRRAPTTPFSAPGQSAAVIQPVDAPAAGTSAPDESYPQLAGIVARDGVWFAVLQLAAADGAPRLYRAGDRHAGYVIDAVSATAVRVTGPSGSRRLTLGRLPTPDSSRTSP